MPADYFWKTLQQQLLFLRNGIILWSSSRSVPPRLRPSSFLSCFTSLQKTRITATQTELRSTTTASRGLAKALHELEMYTIFFHYCFWKLEKSTFLPFLRTLDNLSQILRYKIYQLSFHNTQFLHDIQYETSRKQDYEPKFHMLTYICIQYPRKKWLWFTKCCKWLAHT